MHIGGLSIPHTMTLEGHSDADVLLHAITDALLGTMSLGDIGTFFPPSDPQWKGADSAIFLRHAADLARACGFTFGNADVTLICEALLMITALGVGVGTLNCYLLTAFPLWERIWSIITRPLFLMSGVFFLYEMMPVKAQTFLWYNPVLHCVGMLRHGIYPTYEANYVNPAYVFCVSAVLLFFGLLLLARNHRKLLES